MVGKRRVFGIATRVLLVAILSGLMVSPALGQQPERVKVFIGFKSQPGPAEQALVRGAGGRIRYTYHLVPAIAASLPESAIQGLLNNPNITRIEPVIAVYAVNVDAELDNSWGVKRIGAGTVHDLGNKGAGVKVAVIDSGIDYTHLDLDANYAGGWDFVNDDDDPMDDAGHGTHVAGTVAAEDNGVGVVGVAPDASLYGLKVLDETGRGDYSHVIAALERAVDYGIQVTNNSYGSSGDPGDTVKEAFDNAYYGKGVLHVCAAGNTGTPPGRGDNVIYPARYESCIAVAATDQSDSRARWSSTGPDLELSAPGVSINSTLLGGGYGTGSGTSMASPHVAGTAALAIAAGVTDVRGALVATADDLGDSGWDPKYGYGLVDADEAAGEVSDPPTVSITSPADGSPFDSGATILFEGTASDTEDGDLTASLVWTSNIDGQIGTGGSFSAILGDGNHTVTASATDSGGKTGSDSIGITVGTPSEPPPEAPMYVTAIEMWYTSAGPNRFIYTQVTIDSSAGDPVSGATVYLEMTLPDGSTASSSGDTGDDGTVTFQLKSRRLGSYTSTVTDVVKSGWIYDSSANVETSETLEVN